MVLADPGFVKAELVEMHDQIEIALQTGGRVLLVRVKRRQKNAVPQIGLAHQRLAKCRGDVSRCGAGAKRPAPHARPCATERRYAPLPGAQRESTSTSSASPSGAVRRRIASSRIAAPSRSPIRTPFTDTAPDAGTR